MKRALVILTAALLCATAAGALADSGRAVIGSDVQVKRLIPVPDEQYGDLEIEVWTAGGPDRVFFPGESVTIGFRTNRDAYVLLYDVDTQGDVSRIYPHDRWDEQFVRGGKTYWVPGRNAGYHLVAAGPPGIERVVALASDAPIADRWDESYREATGWNDRGDWRDGHGYAGRSGGEGRSVDTDRLSQRLIEVPDDGPGLRSATDTVTFEIGRARGYGRDGGWRWRRGR